MNFTVIITVQCSRTFSFNQFCFLDNFRPHCI